MVEKTWIYRKNVTEIIENQYVYYIKWYTSVSLLRDTIFSKLLIEISKSLTKRVNFIESSTADRINFYSINAFSTGSLGHTKYISIREKAPVSTYVDNLCAARLKGAWYTEKIQYIPAENSVTVDSFDLRRSANSVLLWSTSEQKRRKEKVTRVSRPRDRTPKYWHLSRICRFLKIFPERGERERES